MSAKPRSVLKKRAGHHDNRRVSFAVPLLSDKDGSRVPTSGATVCPAAKKSKPTEEAVDIIMLGNQQCELTENVQDIERKLEKQMDMMHGMTKDLLAFGEPLAAFSSESKKVHLKIAEHGKLLAEVEARRDELLEKCKRLEMANTSQSENSSIIVDIHKAVSLINCYRMDDSGVSDEASGDYDKLLTLIDQYIASV